MTLKDTQAYTRVHMCVICTTDVDNDWLIWHLKLDFRFEPRCADDNNTESLLRFHGKRKLIIRNYSMESLPLVTYMFELMYDFIQFSVSLHFDVMETWKMKWACVDICKKSFRLESWIFCCSLVSRQIKFRQRFWQRNFRWMTHGQIYYDILVDFNQF